MKQGHFLGLVTFLKLLFEVLQRFGLKCRKNGIQGLDAAKDVGDEPLVQAGVGRGLHGVHLDQVLHFEFGGELRDGLDDLFVGRKIDTHALIVDVFQARGDGSERPGERSHLRLLELLEHVFNGLRAGNRRDEFRHQQLRFDQLAYILFCFFQGNIRLIVYQCLGERVGSCSAGGALQRGIKVSRRLGGHQAVEAHLVIVLGVLEIALSMVIAASGQIKAGVGTEAELLPQGRIGADLLGQVVEVLHVEPAAPPVGRARAELQLGLAADLSGGAGGEQAKGRGAADHARYVTIQRLLELLSFIAFRLVVPG